MKFTESMLRDLVQTSMSAEEVGDLLTMTGFELEEVTVVEGEKVLDINVMANRGDGASVYGLAREVLAKDSSARPTDLYRRLSDGYFLGDETSTEILASASVRIDSKDCTRFSCRVFEGLTNGAAPDWIQERLRKIGQRPISLLVDLTNYVMHETGQPLHAYDLDTLREGAIIVRSAKDGEELTTLDGTRHVLQSGQLMICDENRPIGVAGVMGGANTEVSDHTSRCLLEAAHFDHRSVRRSRKQLGLQTDASYRFERYCDPDGTVRALNRFADLLRQCTGVSAVPGVIDEFPSPPVRTVVSVRPDRVTKLLGTPVSESEIEGYLQKLGFQVARKGQELQVRPPSWRIDLEREDDFVEEVGRVHGYDRIPSVLPIGSTPVGGAHGRSKLVDRVRERVLRSGFTQCISHSLCDVHPLDLPGERVVVRNPHSPEIAHLRNSCLPNLCEVALRNGGRNVRLFEIGRVFSPGLEGQQLAMLSVGSSGRSHFRAGKEPDNEFFGLKGAVEDVLRGVGYDPVFRAPSAADPRLHPTRQADWQGCARIGQIHPLVAEEAGISADACLAEIDLALLWCLKPQEEAFRPFHRHPSVRRDMAVVLDKSVTYETIENVIREACGDVLERQWLFDVYEGPGIDPGQHSLGIALLLRKAGTFTDEEANQVRDRAVQALGRLGATLR